MRKLAAIVICPLLSFVLNGCSADAPPPPTTPAKAAVAAPLVGKAAKKTTKRRPKLEAITKQEKTIKPFAD